MIRATAFALLIGAVASAAPVPPENDVTRLARIYGTPGEFGEKSAFKMDREKLWFYTAPRDIPPPPRPLRDAQGRVIRDAQGRVLGMPRNPVDPGPIGYPHVWRGVSGDFTAVVRVEFQPVPKQPGNLNARVHRAAGVVCLSTTIDHLTIAHQGSAIERQYTRASGSLRGTTSPNQLSDAVVLRLRREGSFVTAGFSQDGKTWDEFLTNEVEWTETVYVGVFVKDESDLPCAVVFDEYKLTVPK